MEVATIAAPPRGELLAPGEPPAILSDYENERGKPMPSTNHAAIQTNISREISNRYEKKFRVLSEASLKLDSVPSVPDVSIYPYFKLNFQRDTIERTDPPLCTIEILSPSQTLKTIVEELEGFLNSGVQSAWVIIPEMEAIAVYHEPGKYTFFKENDLLVDAKLGIELPLERVFE